MFGVVHLHDISVSESEVSKVSSIRFERASGIHTSGDGGWLSISSPIVERFRKRFEIP